MIQVRNLGWSWDRPVLERIDLDIPSGARVLVTGPSGGGKSTLLRLLLGTLHGARRVGTVSVGGGDPADWTPAERVRTVGWVQQEPSDQAVTGSVAEEIRFSAGNAGRTVDVDAWLERVGLEVPHHTDPMELSGGQQQRLAVASTLAAGAQVVLLDEPFAHLDPVGSADLLALLASLSVTVVLVEHRLESVLDWATEVVVLREGRLAYVGGEPPTRLLEGEGLSVPPMRQVQQAGGLDALGPRQRDRAVGAAYATLAIPAVVQGGVELLPASSLTLHRGERLALVGANGVGKSSLLAAIASVGPDSLVAVPQNPDLALFCSSVAEEVRYSPEEQGLVAMEVLTPFGLSGLEGRPPLSLSRGQRLRLAVAGAVAGRPEVLLLDEPTAGQHHDAAVAVFESLDALLPDTTVVFATHDVEFALRFATRIWPIGLGEAGPPGEAIRRVPLPPLQTRQAHRGLPLVSASVQISGEPAAMGQRFDPVRALPPIPRPARVHRAEPQIWNLLLLGGLGAVTILLERPASLVVTTLLGLGFLWTRPLPVRTRAGVTGGLVLIVWTTLLSQGLFYGDRPRTLAFALGPLAVWREGVYWGMVQSLRLVGVAAVGAGLALSSRPARLTRLIRAAGVQPGLAFLAAMSIQTVPRVASNWLEIRTARASRGRPIWQRGPLSWIQTERAMLRPLVVRALQRAGRIAETLDARGFSLASLPSRAPWTGMDRAVAVGLAGLLAVLVSLQLLTWAYHVELYHHPDLRPLYAWVHRWL